MPPGDAEMELLFSTLPHNIIGCFKRWMLVRHLTAILLTLVLVVSGSDWLYFQWTRSPILRSWLRDQNPVVVVRGLPT